MGTRLIRVKTSVNVIAGYNNAGSNGTVGVKVANCVDSTGVSTGISVHVTGAFTSSGGSSTSWATADYHGLAESYWEWAWNSSTNGGGVIELRGFPVGKSVTVGLTGWALNATRHTDFRVNGVALSRYTNKNALPPNAPVTIVATADSNGYITITGNFVDSFWYINGLTASYEDAPLISSIDKLESGSTSTVTTSDTSFAATSASITSDTVTKTVSASNAGSGSFTFTPPSWVDGTTSLKYGVSNTVTGSDGTTTTQSGTATLTLPPPYAAVVLTSVSDDSIDKIAGISPAYTVSTQVVYRSDHGTVYPNGTWDDLIWDGEYWVSSGYIGSTYLAHRDPTDKIARVGTFDTTIFENTTPDAFTFGSVTNANLSTDTTGPTQATIAGVTAGIDILATPDSGLSYRFKTSSGGAFGSWLTTASNVQLGYVIEAKLTSSGSYDTEVVKGLDIGGTVGTLTVRTKASDLVPDAFTFEPRTNVTPGAIIPSKTTVTVEGVSPALDIAISQSGLEFRISTNDGVSYGSWRTTSTNVQLGHKVQVRIQTSDLPFTLSTGTLTIGGVSADFNATTGSASGGGGVAEDTLGMTTLKMEPL